MALYKMDSLNSMSMITSICTAGAKAGAWSSSGHCVCEEQQGDKAHGGCMPVCHSSAQAIGSVLPRSSVQRLVFVAIVRGYSLIWVEKMSVSQQPQLDGSTNFTSR